MSDHEDKSHSTLLLLTISFPEFKYFPFVWHRKLNQSLYSMFQHWRFSQVGKGYITRKAVLKVKNTFHRKDILRVSG